MASTLGFFLFFFWIAYGCFYKGSYDVPSGFQKRLIKGPVGGGVGAGLGLRLYEHDGS